MSMKTKTTTTTKRTKMEMSSHELTYSFLLIVSLVVFSFPNLSSSQYNSPPQNIETHYPYWPPPPPTPSLLSPSPAPGPSSYPYYSPPPPPPSPLEPSGPSPSPLEPSGPPPSHLETSGPPPPPPVTPPSEPPSSSPSKKIITAVGVTAASALVVAALVFLLVSKFSKSRRKNEANSGGGGGGGGPPLPVVDDGRRRMVVKPRGNAPGWVVDEDGLDHVLWKELKTPADRNRVHPEPGAGDGSTSVALHAVGGSAGRDHQPQLLEEAEGPIDHSSGEMMEAIFGTLAVRKSSQEENISSSIAGESSNAKIFILDPSKSENIATVLRSLGISRGKLITALLEGKGVSGEALEKLSSTALTREEVSEIRAFSGDPIRLADAESFLHALLKAVPSAYARADQMLFWHNYDTDVLNLKESLQTLESACDELRTRGIILKLLQAIHNTATRLCSGELSEEAKAFKLSTLRKLSDYKSTDGKTTLLHFVVHQVVRNEGRRCVMARNSSLSRNSSISRQNSSPAPQDADDSAASKVEKEKEYLMLGLPIVGGLSSEFANVKKAANMDYDALKDAIAFLVNRVKEVRQRILNDRSTDGGGGFQMEMRYLLESAEVETKAAQLEHMRVMTFVKKTSQYYQAGTSNKDENPLQLFIIVTDFLSMIDLTCVEIARGLQQKQPAASEGSDSGSDPSQPDPLRNRVNFPRLPEHFFSDAPTASLGDDS